MMQSVSKNIKTHWRLFFAIPAMLFAGFLGITGNVYADDNIETVEYFNIEIKAISTTAGYCPGGEVAVFGDANGAGTSYMTCPGGYQNQSSEKTYTAEISLQNGHALVNDAYVANYDDVHININPSEAKDNNMSISVGSETPVNGITTKGRSLSDIRADIQNGLSRNMPPVSHTGNVKEIKYEFSVGDIGTREKKVYGSQTTNSNGAAPTCMSAAGTSLGWILCPAADALNGVTDWAYNELLKPALEIEPQLFTQGSFNPSTGETTATSRQAWDVFRNIANTLFIVLLLVVIFSQLTGVGIDNYGIKKIMPKLIVSAILINLSYWICVACVDLSNILGESLQNMFASLPPSQNQIPTTVGGVDLGGMAKGAVTFVAVLGVLAGSVGVAIMAAGGGVAFLISILIAALGAVVSIFFLFLLLAAREAAIVVLVVISPLAFACYMLPNTQNLFKKWWGLGWKLLMVFPVAGLLMGGGDYVSRLLLLTGAGGNGFFSAFAAVIAGIVPIFFIPAVLKNSFAAMGNLGAKISGIGQKVGGRLSGNTDKAIRGSERFKNYQSDHDRQRKIRAAERVMRRNQGRELDPNSRRARAYSQAQSILLGEEAETRKRENLLNGGYESALAGVQAKARDEQISNRLSLMQNQGVGDGAYTLGNMKDRMEELAVASGNRVLTTDEQLEMAALARGMTQEKGGAGMLNKIIKEQSNTGNQNFVGAMRDINKNDANVRTKLREKSQGVGAYLEGGAGTDGTYAQYQGTSEYTNEMQNRIKNHQVGLSQSGDDMDEYLATIAASPEAKETFQSIVDDQSFLATLDNADQVKVMNAAKNVGVTGTTTQMIQQQQVQQAAHHTQNMQDMTDELKKINQKLGQHGGGSS